MIRIFVPIRTAFFATGNLITDNGNSQRLNKNQLYVEFLLEVILKKS